jgi:hypothetical protein
VNRSRFTPEALNGSGKSLAHTKWTYKQNQESEDQPLALNSLWQRPIRKSARDAWMAACVDSGKLSHDAPSASPSTRHVGFVTRPTGLEMINLCEDRRNDQK